MSHLNATPFKQIIAISTYFAIIVFFRPVSAQDDYGVKGGIALTSLTGQSGANFKPGVQFGGYAKYGGSEVLFLKGELLFTQKGTWNWETDLKNTSLYYLELPVFFGLNVDWVDGLSLNLGIQPGVLLVGQYRSKELDGSGNSVQNITSESNRFDFGILFGAEYQYTKKVLFGIRYTTNYVPLQEYNTTIYNTSNNLPVSRALQLYVSYSLKKGEE